MVGGALALIGGAVLLALYAEKVRLRFGVLLVAGLLTTTLLYQLTRERVRIPPRPPEVTYISTFEPGRSDTDIEATNLANQKLQDRLRVEQAEREEKAKDAYRALGRATGIDVDAMERDIARREAQENQSDSGTDAPND